MAPGAMTLNDSNSADVNAVTQRKIALKNLAVGRPYRSHIRLGKFGSAVSLALMMFRRPESEVNCVLNISPGRHPLKIIRAVISPIAVYVVDLITVRSLVQKCSGDKAMNSLALARHSSLGKRDLRISAGRRIERRVENLTYPSNSAEVADFIPTLPTYNRSPLFAFQRQGEGYTMRMHRKTPFGAMQRDGSGRRRCLIITHSRDTR